MIRDNTWLVHDVYIRSSPSQYMTTHDLCMMCAYILVHHVAFLDVMLTLDEGRLRLRDTMGAWFSYQLQPPVATAPLHSPSWKQRGMKPVILASIAREQRSTTHVEVELRRLPPRDCSRQKSDLVRKIQHRRLRSLCAAPPSSKWRTFFRLAFTVCEKSGN